MLAVFPSWLVSLEEELHCLWFLRVGWHVVFSVEEVSGGERLIIRHGMARLDGSIFILPLGFPSLPYRHLESARTQLGT